MREEINLATVLAYVISKCKYVLIGMIVFATLLGAYKGIKEIYNWRGYDLELEQEKYDVALEDYLRKKDSIEIRIHRTEQILSAKDEYLDTSYYMALDSNNVYHTAIDILVDLENDDDFTTTVEYNTTPINYITTKISDVYLSLWDRVDLGELIGTQDEYVDFYLREMISTKPGDNGIIRIECVGNTESESLSWATMVRDYLIEKSNDVEKVTYKHSLVEVSRSTEKSADSSVYEKQIMYLNDYTSKVTTLESLCKEKDALVEPQMVQKTTFRGVIKGVFKFFFVGAIAGMVLLVGWYVVVYVLSDKLYATSEVKEELHASYLGSVFADKQKKFKLSTIISRILGERVWGDAEQAEAYAINSITCTLSKKKILLVSTLKNAEVASALNTLARSLKAAGIETTIIENGLCSTELIRWSYEEGDVVLLEEREDSKIHAINELMELICKRNGNILGVVMLQK